jgi:hypothetical protein
MAKINQEQIAALKQQHGKRLYLIEDDEIGDIVFKPATQDVWGEFIDAVGPVDTDGPTRTLVDACVVFPDTAELQRVHAEYPAFADALAAQIRIKSGGRSGLTPKAL